MNSESTNTAKEILKCNNVDEYCKKLMDIVRNTQKFSNELQGWHHYADYSGVNLTMGKINTIIHRLVSTIFNHQDVKLDIKNCKLKEQFEIIREGNDALLEKVNVDVDEARGVRRDTDVLIADSNVRTIRSVGRDGSGREMILTASRNVQKPQIFFDPKINNSAADPFIPSITDKPNSIKPLSVLICFDENDREFYSHPYIYELEHWRPSERDLRVREPVQPKPLSSTPFQLIQDLPSLRSMLEELRNVDTIAVDLEHHNFRSYLGLTSLIQISTQKKDYVIDPFPLRNHLSILNEVFTHPKITKVFHGADKDVLWLQRDFGIYLVNMFDTHQAAIVLDYPHRSLANLLYSFCSLSVNKTYQRADWRIRPLPDDFLEYARTDTHYLIYIYDCLKKELTEKGNELNNLLLAVYDRSTELCMKRYEKPFTGPDSHLDIYRRSRKMFNNRQLFALQHIYRWRDRVAREQDESADYVLPKHMLLQIAEVLPKEVQGIFACCNPIPSLVKTEHLTIHQIIRKARELPLQDIITTVTHQDHTVVNEDFYSKFLCKHDLSSIEADPKGLNTILSQQEALLGDLFTIHPINVSLKNKSNLFGVSKDVLHAFKGSNMSRTKGAFYSPFLRYQMLVEAEENGIDAKDDVFKEESEEIKPKNIADDDPATPKINESDLLDEFDSDILARLNRLQKDVQSIASLPNSEMIQNSENMDATNHEENKGVKRNKNNDGNKKKSKKGKKMKGRNVKQETNATEKIELDQIVESFEYAKADFDVFKRKRKNFRGNPKKFRGSFKGKSIVSPSERPDSEAKSFTWAKPK